MSRGAKPSCESIHCLPHVLVIGPEHMDLYGFEVTVYPVGLDVVLVLDMILYLDDIPNSLGLKNLHDYSSLCHRLAIV
jgi:hypothetical protein